MTFRDRICPDLEDIETWESSHRTRSKNMSITDLEHCSKLLRHPDMKLWGQMDESSMIWVNGHRNTRKADWMSVLARKVVGHVKELEEVTVLRHFAIDAYGHKTGSTVGSVLHSMVFQALQKHRLRFLSNRSGLLCVTKFEEAKDDVEKLFKIFEEVVRSSKTSCIWLVIDHIDILKKKSRLEDITKFLGMLNNMMDQEPIILKVLVTARVGGSKFLSDIARKVGAIAPQHAIINVPRGN